MNDMVPVIPLRSRETSLLFLLLSEILASPIPPSVDNTVTFSINLHAPLPLIN